MKKHISLLLALIMLLFSFCTLVSCTGTGGGSSEKQPESESTSPDDAWYVDLDFGGATLTVSQSVNVWDTSSSIPNAVKYTRGPEDISSDEVLNMCYSRNREVTRALNIEVKYVETNYYFDEINPYLDQIATMAASPSDLVINDIYAARTAILKGQFYNLKSQAEDNYFDFTHESWYTDFIDGYTFDTDYAFIAAGDYFIDVVRSAHVLYVNTDLFEVQLSEDYESMKDFYRAILNGEWTYDVMQDLVARGWKSTSGTSYVTIDDDIIGWWMPGAAIEWALKSSASFEMLERTDTGFILKEDTTNISDLAEVLCSAYNGDGVYHLTDDKDGGLSRELFTGGSVLFASGFWLGDLEYPSFYAMESKAPIVYPRWNETFSKYCSYVHNSAEIGYVMTNVKDFPMVSAYVELLNEKSVDVMQEYFEYQLKYKQNTDPEALAMIDLVRDNIRVEAYTLANYSARIKYWDAMVANNPASVANTYLSNRITNEETVNEALLTFYQMNKED